MSKEQFIKKITSRKFLLTAVMVIGGLAAAMQKSGNATVNIVGIVSAGVATVAYGIIEGKIDKTSVEQTATDAITKIEDATKKTSENKLGF